MNIAHIDIEECIALTDYIYHQHLLDIHIKCDKFNRKQYRDEYNVEKKE